MSDLKPGQKVRGTTIAELGNRNKPLDIILFRKERGKDFMLIADGPHGVIRLPASQLPTRKRSPARPARKLAFRHETVGELTSVVQLNSSTTAGHCFYIKGDGSTLGLKTVPAALIHSREARAKPLGAGFAHEPRAVIPPTLILPLISIATPAHSTGYTPTRRPIRWSSSFAWLRSKPALASTQQPAC